jgi:phosphoribosylaminoimidazolecarboxamide formyltransferase/IMP cyclohydrolase
MPSIGRKSLRAFVSFKRTELDSYLLVPYTLFCSNTGTHRATLMKKIERALISVSDKEGIIEFARGLREMGVEILASGGTARYLKDHDIDITLVSDYTDSPEILDGRVKTLHPKIHGGLLNVRGNPRHEKELKQHGIKSIDMLVVNLYPFEETVSREDVTLEQAIENIDIGGPSMLRSAAKNYQDVIAVCSPLRYEEVMKELKKNNGTIPNPLKIELATEVFKLTSYYDSLIYTFLHELHRKREVTSAPRLTLSYTKIADLDSGENPHQKGSIYRERILSEPCVIAADLLHGEALTFSDYLDLNVACELLKDFGEPTAVIVKSGGPCGVASDRKINKAYAKARETDPKSSSGSVVGFNRNVDIETAEELNKTSIQAIIAPGYNIDALEALKYKKDRRLVLLEGLESWCMVGGTKLPDRDVRKIVGGILSQDRDIETVDPRNLQCVTKREPTPEELRDLIFAWKVARQAKSHAAVFASGTQTLGIGAGQDKHLDAVKVAAMKSVKPLNKSICAVDGALKYDDGLAVAIENGVSAIIQTGSLVRDEKAIEACDANNVAMVFTGISHHKY